MNRKRILLFAAMILLLAGALLQCSGTTHYGISEGLYRMENGNGEPAAYIHFDMDDEGVSFVLGVENMSYSCHGSVKLDGQANLLTDTGEKWVFEVVDNDTLRFDAGKSESNSFQFPDNALFLYADKK